MSKNARGLLNGKEQKDGWVVDAAAAFGHYCRKACWEDLGLEVGGGRLHAALFFQDFQTIMWSIVNYIDG